MTSPINNINRSGTDAVSSSNGKSRAKAADSSTETSARRPQPADDTVSLSEASTQVRELQNQLNDVPEVDAEKVAAIKQEIAKGNYPLDPERIAQNLLNIEKALSDL